MFYFGMVQRSAAVQWHYITSLSESLWELLKVNILISKLQPQLEAKLGWRTVCLTLCIILILFSNQLYNFNLHNIFYSNSSQLLLMNVVCIVLCNLLSCSFSSFLNGEPVCLNKQVKIPLAKYIEIFLRFQKQDPHIST